MTSLFPNLTTDLLTVTCYSNGGDSLQVLVLPLPGASFLVVRSNASHGYASASSPSIQISLSAIVTQLRTDVERTFGSREAEVTIEGGASFTKHVLALRAYVAELVAQAA